MNPQLFDFTSPNGVPFTARLLVAGMGYGTIRDGTWTLTSDTAEPVVEFFDRRYDHSPFGQFVSSYNMSTLEQRERGPGDLRLDGGVPEWDISDLNVQDSIAALKPRADELQKQKSMLLSVFLSNRGNPDYAQDTRKPLPGTPDDLWVPVDTLMQASALCQAYRDTFNLGSGNWSGGRVKDVRAKSVARVSFNGRVFAPGKELVKLEDVASVKHFQTVHFERLLREDAALRPRETQRG
jgi:hypothetical protein